MSPCIFFPPVRGCNSQVLAVCAVAAEFLRFVQNQEKCRKRWLDSGSGNSDLKDEIKRLEQQNAKLEITLKHAW